MLKALETFCGIIIEIGVKALYRIIAGIRVVKASIEVKASYRMTAGIGIMKVSIEIKGFCRIIAGIEITIVIVYYLYYSLNIKESLAAFSLL